MGKYRKKPVIIEAVQWFKMGDHPAVTSMNAPFAKHPWCGVCGKNRREHGVCPTLEGQHLVCPGDWIITGVKGENYPCKPDIFEATYEPAE